MHNRQKRKAIFLPWTSICFIQGEDLFSTPPKEEKFYEFKIDFLSIDEKSG
jgi:hypothetical protein